MERINEIHILFNTMLRYDKNVVMAGNLNEAKKFEELARQVRQELLSKAEEYSHLVTLADDRSRLEELRHLFSQYVTVQDKIHEDGRHDTNAEAAVLSEKQGQTDELEALLQQLHERLAAREPVLETQNASGATLTMAKELEQLLTDERNLMLATTDAEMVPTQQKLKASVAAIAKQRETFRRLPDAQDRALAEQFFERFDKWMTVHEKVVSLAAENTKTKAGQLSMGEGAKLATQITKQIDGMTATLRKSLDETKVEAENTYTHARQVLLGTVALALLIAVAGAIWMSLSISRGISSAVTMASSIAGGDLTQQLKVTSNDEIKDLAGALNSMVEKSQNRGKRVAERIR